MCLGVPGRIVEIDRQNSLALVETWHVRRWVSLHILDEEVEVGDYLMVHAGFAIGRIGQQDAEETFRLLEEAGLYEPP
jgi:hydrogenase expression/formation protein HypC